MKGVISQKETANTAAVALQQTHAVRTVRVVGLDTLSPRMFPPIGPYVVRMTPAPSLSELRAVLNRHLQEIGAENVVWVHFIKHKSTLKILRGEFAELPQEPNYATYKYAPGDVLLIGVLRRRPRPCVLLMPEDLSYWLVTAELQLDIIPKL
jgi:broad specificity phosphatase PhoE